MTNIEQEKKHWGEKKGGNKTVPMTRMITKNWKKYYTGGQCMLYVTDEDSNTKWDWGFFNSLSDPTEQSTDPGLSQREEGPRWPDNPSQFGNERNILSPTDPLQNTLKMIHEIANINKWTHVNSILLWNCGFGPQFHLERSFVISLCNYQPMKVNGIDVWYKSSVSGKKSQKWTRVNSNFP